MKTNLLFFMLCLWTLDSLAAPKQKKGGQQTTATSATPSEPTPKANEPATIKLVEPEFQEPPSIPRETSEDDLGSRQSAHSSPLELLKSNPETPRLSAEEIKTIEAIQKTESALSKYTELLQKSVDEGWVTGTEVDTPATLKPERSKSWLDYFTELPKNWWQEHVTDKNRVEFFMRYTAMVRTYVILCQKEQKGELKIFIDDLNFSNEGEGNRWLDEALVHAVSDQNEPITRKLMRFAIPYKEGLTPATRKLIYNFLTVRAELKRKSLEEDNKDFVLDMHDLAEIMQQTMPSTGFEISKIPIEEFEDMARQSALNLTKRSTGNYLPRITEKK